VAFRSVMVVVNATNGVRLPSTGLASDPSVVPYPRVYTDAAAGPIAAPGQVDRNTRSLRITWPFQKMCHLYILIHVHPSVPCGGTCAHL
jgi:hypothetical protein